MVSNVTTYLLELAEQARQKAARDPVRAARHRRIESTLTEWAQRNAPSGKLRAATLAQPDEGICYGYYNTN
jgi:hypothetical protein